VVIDLFDSIPCGWIIEIRRGPREYGKMYKVLNADIELNLNLQL
jgi:hypothetical protein